MTLFGVCSPQNRRFQLTPRTRQGTFDRARAWGIPRENMSTQNRRRPPRNWAVAFAFGVILAGGFPRSASALLIIDPTSPTFGNANGNTSAPAGAYSDFQYWSNYFPGGAYIGNGYFMSALHVFTPGDQTTFNGVTYNTTSKVLLHAPGNAGIHTDIWIWKVDGTPAVPSSSIITSTPTAGEEVLIVAGGAGRRSTPTYWDVTYNNPGADVWTETPTAPTAEAKGFFADGVGGKRWGTNKVALSNVSLEFDTSYITEGFATEFSLIDSTPWEAQGSNGDSGGPIYVKRGGQWYLAGFTEAIGSIQNGEPANFFDGQPTAAPYPGIFYYTNPDFPGQVMGSATYFSDLSAYQDQLLAFGVPLPEPATATGLLLFTAYAALARRR
jgi:hypothetical protein